MSNSPYYNPPPYANDFVNTLPPVHTSYERRTYDYHRDRMQYQHHEHSTEKRREREHALSRYSFDRETGRYKRQRKPRERSKSIEHEEHREPQQPKPQSQPQPRIEPCEPHTETPTIPQVIQQSMPSARAVCTDTRQLFMQHFAPNLTEEQLLTQVPSVSFTSNSVSYPLQGKSLTQSPALQFPTGIEATPSSQSVPFPGYSRYAVRPDFRTLITLECVSLCWGLLKSQLLAQVLNHRLSCMKNMFMCLIL